MLRPACKLNQNVSEMTIVSGLSGTQIREPVYASTISMSLHQESPDQNESDDFAECSSFRFGDTLPKECSLAMRPLPNGLIIQIHPSDVDMWSNRIGDVLFWSGDSGWWWPWPWGWRDIVEACTDCLVCVPANMVSSETSFIVFPLCNQAIQTIGASTSRPPTLCELIVSLDALRRRRRSQCSKYQRCNYPSTVCRLVGHHLAVDVMYTECVRCGDWVIWVHIH